MTENVTVHSFTSWFNGRTLLKLEDYEEWIEKYLERGDARTARALIDWAHGMWIRYPGHQMGNNGHLAGPYCRVSAKGYACRAMAIEEGSMPDDPPPTPEDAS